MYNEMSLLVDDPIARYATRPEHPGFVRLNASLIRRSEERPDTDTPAAQHIHSGHTCPGLREETGHRPPVLRDGRAWWHPVHDG
jgi:hypothetical protein